MTIDDSLAEKLLDEMSKHFITHPLTTLVHDIIGDSDFIFNEIMAGYITDAFTDLTKIIKVDEEFTFDTLMDKTKHFFDKYYEELSRKSDRDIHITLEDFLSDYPGTNSTEIYPVFNLVLYWMNSMGISPIFASRFTDKKELRMKIGDFICYYFDFVISNSPEEPRKQGLLDLYGVVIFRYNLKELAIDFLMEECK